MISVNEQLFNVRESATVAMSDRVRKLRAAGKQVIGLQTGDPDFATPQPIVDAAYDAMRRGNTHYANSRGLPELRQAIARKVLDSSGVNYDPATEILVTCGGVHAYYTGLQAILNPGDEVLIPDPIWMTHANMVRVLRGTVVRVPSTPENGFWPTFEAWEQAASPRAVALVINSPNNPTGMVAAQDYLRRLNEFAAAHKLYVISDEVYQHLLYDGCQHTGFTSLDGAKQRTLLVDSLSKTYAMTGWRVGYLAAPAALIDLALKASQHSITNLAPFIQEAAIVALTDPDVAEACQQMLDAYTRRRELVLRLWRERPGTPVRLIVPQGAFYFFLDLRALGVSSLEIAERLLEEASIALVPGSAFGECGEGFLRMTIAASDSDVEAGFSGLLDWMEERFPQVRNSAGNTTL